MKADALAAWAVDQAKRGRLDRDQLAHRIRNLIQRELNDEREECARLSVCDDITLDANGLRAARGPDQMRATVEAGIRGGLARMIRDRKERG